MYAEGIYHVAAHASDDRDLFHDDTDRHDFLAQLAAVLIPFGLGIVSYVLMGNHYHSLVTTPDARIAQALQRLHTGYSRWINRRHGRRAHLFRAHCVARRIEDDNDLLGVSRYLAWNPVEAGLVIDPLDWPWSSARAHAGIERPPIALTEGPLRAAHADASDWRERYRRLIAP